MANVDGHSVSPSGAVEQKSKTGGSTAFVDHGRKRRRKGIENESGHPDVGWTHWTVPRTHPARLLGEIRRSRVVGETALLSSGLAGGVYTLALCD